MANKKILVTGANGQLGKSLHSIAAEYPSFDFTFAGRDSVAVDDAVSVSSAFAEVKPDFCVNAAAFTAVDKAETDNATARIVNGTAVGILAAACAAAGAKFIHVSTDYVFNGLSEVPYKEDHPTDPVNQYGTSKLLGEALALLKNPESVIIRTAWVYSEYGNNFVKTMMRLMKERKEVGVVMDQIGAPTYARDLAHAILDIISGSEWVPGIYHYSNRGKISWYEFAEAIKIKNGFDCVVKPITTPEFPTPAKRPAFSLLDTSKISETFELRIPGWEESLDVCLGNLNSPSAAAEEGS